MCPLSFITKYASGVSDLNFLNDYDNLSKIKYIYI